MKEMRVLDIERLTQFLYFSNAGVSHYPNLTDEDYSELQDACEGDMLCVDVPT